MSILIIGANGGVGSKLVDQLKMIMLILLQVLEKMNKLKH